MNEKVGGVLHSRLSQPLQARLDEIPLSRLELCLARIVLSGNNSSFYSAMAGREQVTSCSRTAAIEGDRCVGLCWVILAMTVASFRGACVR